MASHAAYLGPRRQTGGVQKRGVHELAVNGDSVGTVPGVRRPAETGRQNGGDVPEGPPPPDQALRCRPG